MKRRILILEDEEDLVEIMKSVLIDEGFEVISANNGEEGLRLVEKSPPDLIVLDINMPKMGGIAFYHKIFDQESQRPQFPVVVVTARANLGDLFRDLNADGFMSKPFKIDDFLREVDTIMAKRYGESPILSSSRPVGTRTQKRILIAESEIGHFASLITALLNAGYMVDPANNAMRAAELAMMDHPDLILINVKLPDLAGDLLAFKLRQMPGTMDIPIVLYASAADREQLRLAKEIGRKAGIKHYIDSANPELLLKECEKILDGGV